MLGPEEWPSPLTGYRNRLTVYRPFSFAAIRPIPGTLNKSAPHLVAATQFARNRNAPAGDAPRFGVHHGFGPGGFGRFRIRQQFTVSDSRRDAGHVYGVGLHQPFVAGRPGTGFPAARTYLRAPEIIGPHRHSK